MAATGGSGGLGSAARNTWLNGLLRDMVMIKENQLTDKMENGDDGSICQYNTRVSPV